MMTGNKLARIKWLQTRHGGNEKSVQLYVKQEVGEKVKEEYKSCGLFLSMVQVN